LEIKVVSEKENPLLRRKEVKFQIEHSKSGNTPPRFEVKSAVAAKLKVKPDMVFVKRLGTRTGTQTAAGLANIYNSVESAHLFEPQYILKRNSPPELKDEEGT